MDERLACGRIDLQAEIEVDRDCLIQKRWERKKRHTFIVTCNARLALPRACFCLPRGRGGEESPAA